MNNIMHVEIDWMERYANRPRFKVKLDEYRPDMLHYVAALEDGGTTYYAIHNALANFMFHSPGCEQGYGGCTFELQMEDGSVRRVKGPWSSRSGCINKLGHYGVQVVEAELIGEHTHIAVSAAHLALACERQGIQLAWVEIFEKEWYLEPMPVKPDSAKQFPVIECPKQSNDWATYMNNIHGSLL